MLPSFVALSTRQPAWDWFGLDLCSRLYPTLVLEQLLLFEEWYHIKKREIPDFIA